MGIEQDIYDRLDDFVEDKFARDEEKKIAAQQQRREDQWRVVLRDCIRDFLKSMSSDPVFSSSVQDKAAHLLELTESNAWTELAVKADIHQVRFYFSIIKL